MPYHAPHTLPPEVTLSVPQANPADPRLAHRLGPWDGETADAVLIGVPFDLGVTLGGGRPGAAQGPTALRQALLRFGTTHNAVHNVNFDHLRLADAGDLDVVADDPGRPGHGEAVAATHERLAAAVGAILDAGAVPIVVGGGNDATFGSVKALTSSAPSVAGVNVDAHLDLREVVDGRITSGTPYRRILEELDLPGKNLVEFGLHSAVNSRAHLDYAAEKGVQCLTLEQARKGGMAGALAWRLGALAAAAEVLFVSIDLDVFAAPFAPGVSSPGTEGLTPEEGRELAFAAGRAPKVTLFELMELNPEFDLDERTSRLAALLLASFLAGLATR